MIHSDHAYRRKLATILGRDSSYLALRKSNNREDNLRVQFHGANNKIEVIRSKSFIPPPPFKGIAISTTTRREGEGRNRVPEHWLEMPTSSANNWSKRRDPTVPLRSFYRDFHRILVSLERRVVPTDRPPSPFPQRNTERSRLISRGIMFSDCHESISNRPPATFLPLSSGEGERQLFIS